MGSYKGLPDTLVLDPLKHVLGYLGERLDLWGRQKVQRWHRSLSNSCRLCTGSEDEAGVPGLLHKTSGFWAETCHDQISFLTLFRGQE